MRGVIIALALSAGLSSVAAPRAEAREQIGKRLERVPERVKRAVRRNAAYITTGALAGSAVLRVFALESASRLHSLADVVHFNSWQEAIPPLAGLLIAAPLFAARSVLAEPRGKAADWMGDARAELEAKQQRARFQRGRGWTELAPDATTISIQRQGDRLRLVEGDGPGAFDHGWAEIRRSRTGWIKGDLTLEATFEGPKYADRVARAWRTLVAGEQQENLQVPLHDAKTELKLRIAPDGGVQAWVASAVERGAPSGLPRGHLVALDEALEQTLQLESYHELAPSGD